MRLVWLRSALQNLQQETEYLAEENPAAAVALVKAVRVATNHLMDFPSTGRPGRVPGTRELVLEGFPYLIPYRVKDDQVQILRIFHTRRRPPKRW
ncbi:type II toxin-antitoxin system RelE/ParE family toxin [Chromobacterium alkanivorans]|uniref:type II toxin-antitoxin system RelE/ParE family toxin n=1 Tax=Chromobacterium TaxID=535 RepID=UPI0006539D57|nr:type II toxin-antitoxin system RelE/ParE family toxin [Chromobacterium sp. LK11]KMN82416.1 plasmid stabilization protein [Chromobacterium sp. LK11]MBN3003954.1 type II toxin-antitoxin system RelE/ParE family toxin [Chromobacterium alkanivorans]